jgi:bacillithiol biosynthesis cysteine-adding enzyme BshC
LQLATKTLMSKAQDVPFKEIPHQSKLFLDYLDLAPEALRFYDQPPTIDRLTEFAKRGFAGTQFPRREISAVLRKQNEAFGADRNTIRNIEELESPHCVAVLTGQQVGLFIAPLYTIYKAITASHIAGELRKNGISAVPIFWMDTEDHDLAEVSRRTVPGPNQGLEVIDYRSILFGQSETFARPVGSLQFSHGIKEAVSDYLNRLVGSEWKSEAQAHLESAYKPGATFAGAFGQLMARIFAGSGLILFDASNVEAKKLTSDVFRRAILEAHTIRESLAQRSRQLESAGFHSQVSVLENSTVLFVVHKGERRALETRDSGFGLKSGDRGFAREELLDLVEHSPEKFSPNVLLRPLVQDHLFPTAAYVGGSSEVAYFAQAEVLYRFFRRPMPAIWPRNSFTLLEPDVASEMDRFGIGLQDCFAGKSAVMEKIIQRSGFSREAAELEELQGRLDRVLSEIRPEVEAVEPTLAQAVETVKRKILHNVHHLKSRLIHVEGQQDSLVLNSTSRLMDACFPNANLQERELGFYSFFVRHGPSLLDKINAAAGPSNLAHVVLRL